MYRYIFNHNLPNIEVRQTPRTKSVSLSAIRFAAENSCSSCSESKESKVCIDERNERPPRDSHLELQLEANALRAARSLVVINGPLNLLRRGRETDPWPIEMMFMSGNGIRTTTPYSPTSASIQNPRSASADEHDDS
ncbi:hypothetical protein EVAR_6798_1 [Eumeta japonica]|uniref:Uncharacterized protein n=1 Tax=Eumeta variegata TaxID=151549 RepID=A0A4C1U7L5_EUMVA|nr:hypothetical protein EVAR_6798_1 [Eumeta japonica]